MRDDAIPPTPSEDDYAEEAKAQAAVEAFGVADDQGAVFGAEPPEGRARDPFALFGEWLTLAGKHEPNDPNAMSLATVDAEGAPDVRVVLLKGVDTGFTFYSNTQSAKGRELEHAPRAALCFHWKTIRRQVRVRGPVEAVSREDSDAYFASRSRGAQIGAWASQQSREMAEPGLLETRVADYEAIYEGRDVPRPDFWRGYRVVPREIEFWVNRPYRLHDRLAFTRGDGGWEERRLYP